MALLDDEHAILGRAEVQLADQTGIAQLVGAQLLEPGHDSAASSDGDQLDFGASNPPNLFKNIINLRSKLLKTETISNSGYSDI